MLLVPWTGGRPLLLPKPGILQCFQEDERGDSFNARLGLRVPSPLGGLSIAACRSRLEACSERPDVEPKMSSTLGPRGSQGVPSPCTQREVPLLPATEAVGLCYKHLKMMSVFCF